MQQIKFGKIENHFWKFKSLEFLKVSQSTINLKNKNKNNQGQGLVEYMVLVALITAGTIGVVRIVGYNIGIQYENINRALGAKAGNQLQAVSAEQSLLNKKDLTNFLNGTK